MEIYEAAYGQARVEGREEPLGAYRMAKWELWGQLEEEDRKPWIVKAKAQRDAINGDIMKAEPPMLAEK